MGLYGIGDLTSGRGELPGVASAFIDARVQLPDFYADPAEIERQVATAYVQGKPAALESFYAHPNLTPWGIKNPMGAFNLSRFFNLPQWWNSQEAAAPWNEGQMFGMGGSPGLLDNLLNLGWKKKAALAAIALLVLSPKARKTAKGLVGLRNPPRRKGKVRGRRLEKLVKRMLARPDVHWARKKRLKKLLARDRRRRRAR